MIKQFFLYQFNLSYVNKVNWFLVFSCIINNSTKHQSFVYTQLNDQTVLFQTIRFIINHLFTHGLSRQFYFTHRTLYSAIPPGQSVPGSDGNEGVFRMSQSSSITGAAPSNGLMSYAGLVMKVMNHTGL